MCTDANECVPAQDIHVHAEQAECVRYLRNWHDGRFADIRDDQCCVCYFKTFDWGEDAVESDQ
jgi:hypothetical protein